MLNAIRRWLRAMATIGSIAALACGLACSPAPAQPYPAQIPFSLDGRLANCGAYSIYLDENLPEVAIARYNGYEGYIILNPLRMANMPTELKLFIFAHECGHLVLRGSEADADCWAVRLGRDQGWFVGENFKYLVDDLANSPGDFTHAPGPERLRHIADCFST